MFSPAPSLRLLVCLLFCAGCSTEEQTGKGGAGGTGGAGGQCPLESVKIDIPVDFSIGVDAKGAPQSLEFNTEGGPIRVLFTPWGTHTEPHTGSPGFEAKTNWQGYLSPPSELSELSGNADGVCDQFELCGVKEDVVESRRPRFVAPDDGFVVEEVRLERVFEPGKQYWKSPNQWRIEANLCGYHYTFGHVGWIGEELRAAMLAAGTSDPESYSGPIGENLLSTSITLGAGDRLAIPQIVGKTDAAHPGYVLGDPWAQMEVPTIHQGIAEPIYRRLPSETQSALRQILQREMQDPQSRMYSQMGFFAWMWKAEADLWLFDEADTEDYSSVLSYLGAWFENAGPGQPCIGLDAGCDESLSIWPMIKTGPVFDASLYDSPAVSYLILKSQKGGSWLRGEVLAPSMLGSEGTLFIKWRLETYLTEIELYQKVSFSLDSSARQLKLNWGPEDGDRAKVEASPDPANPNAIACDGATVVCMNHLRTDAGEPLPGY